MNEDYSKIVEEQQTSLFKDSPIFNSMLQSFTKPYQTQQDKLLWLKDNILNVELATGYQLDFIGGIVGQSRLLVDFSTEPYFGFEGAYQAESFGTLSNPAVGGYWDSYSYTNVSGSRRLTDSEYIRVIKARIAYNNSHCSIDEFLSVVNFLNNTTNTSVSIDGHIIKLSAPYFSEIFTYFVSKIDTSQNILPVPVGKRLQLSE